MSFPWFRGMKWGQSKTGKTKVINVHGKKQQVQWKELGFPGDSGGKESTSKAGDVGLSPGQGRSPGEGNGNALQYSGLENPMDRGAWWATVHWVAKELGLPDGSTQNTQHLCI